MFCSRLPSRRSRLATVVSSTVMLLMFINMDCEAARNLVMQGVSTCNRGEPYKGHIADSSTKGAYVGLHFDYASYNWDLSAFTRKLGFTPAVFVMFISFPSAPVVLTDLGKILKQIALRRAIAIVTVEPAGGLHGYTDADIDALGAVLLTHQNQGANIIIRFAHEMNGAWYPWAQRPLQYVTAWRHFVQRIRQCTCRTAFLWAPNEGVSYPFGSDIHAANITEVKAMDTNGDGDVTILDDPYAPYYPGDKWVDFVGMSNFHFGNTYPWGKNEKAEPKKFAHKMLGGYIGVTGDGRAVPNFYEQYSKRPGKPMVVPETAAWFNPAAQDGGDEKLELELKSAWFRQVYAAGGGDTAEAVDLSAALPMLKIICWFDMIKREASANNQVIDMSITTKPAIRKAFVKQVASSSYWKHLSDFRRTQPPWISAAAPLQVSPIVKAVARPTTAAKAAVG